MRLNRRLIGVVKALLFAMVCSPVSADGLLVPKVGGCSILSAESLAVEKDLKLDSRSVPLVAAHPTSPVVATVTPEQGLVFWNAPGFSEASRSTEALLTDGIVDLAFSHDGSSLFLLSAPLRSVLVFDLATSKVSSVVPVPGGDGQRLWGCEAGILVRQGDGVTVLSPSPKPGLLAQYRYAQPLLAVLCESERLYASVEGDPGIWVYDVKAGQTLGLLPSEGSTVALGRRTADKGVVMVEADGTVAARDFKSFTPNWSYRGQPASSQGVEVLRGVQSLYLYNKNDGSLVALSGASGQVLAQAVLGSDVGRPVFFSAGR